MMVAKPLPSHWIIWTTQNSKYHLSFFNHSKSNCILISTYKSKSTIDWIQYPMSSCRPTFRASLVNSFKNIH
eukprot:Gb_25890 [translate_table: standard]